MIFRLPRGWGYALLALVAALALAWWPLAQSLAQVTRSFPVDQLEAYQLANLSQGDEIALGDAIDRQLKQDGLVIYEAGEEIKAYLNRVGQRVVAASNYPARRYRFQLVDDEVINAFATVGGYIYLHTGLLEVIQNEAELAAVLAHEVGHIEEQDGLNQLWHQLSVQELSQQGDRMRQRMAEIGGQLRSLSNSQADEYIADVISFHILGRAGYAQSAAVTLLERLSRELTPATPLGLISSHPNPQSRVEQLQRLLTTEASPEASGGLEQTDYVKRVIELIEQSEDQQGGDQ
ncbi:MAG: M48 family metalloprotease [Nodosilinea sp.]